MFGTQERCLENYAASSTGSCISGSTWCGLVVAHCLFRDHCREVWLNSLEFFVKVVHCGSGDDSCNWSSPWTSRRTQILIDNLKSFAFLIFRRSGSDPDVDHRLSIQKEYILVLNVIPRDLTSTCSFSDLHISRGIADSE